MPRVLVADDNSNIQKMATLALKDAGIDVVAVSNGEAAVRKLADLTPDLILADIFMPVRSGYELCEYVKTQSRYTQIPVILLVGAFDPFDEKEARRVQADGVLKKPFVPADPLINMVKALLGRLASENLGEDTVPVSPSGSFAPGEAFHSGPSRADLARAANRASQPSAGALPQSSSTATGFAVPEFAEAEFATSSNVSSELSPDFHGSQAGDAPLLDLPDAEDDADLVSTTSRDPILGEPAFWSPAPKVEDEPVAEITEVTEGHSWGLAPQHEEAILPSLSDGSETQIESAIGSAMSDGQADAGPAQHHFVAEFDSAGPEISEIKDRADSDVVHDQFAGAINEAAPQMETTSLPTLAFDPQPRPAPDLISHQTLNQTPDPTLDLPRPAVASMSESARDLILESPLGSRVDSTVDPSTDRACEPASAPSPYDGSPTPNSAVDSAVENAPASSEPAWRPNQSMGEWEAVAPAVVPTETETAAGPPSHTEAAPAFDTACDPVEAHAAEPGDMPEARPESQSAQQESEAGPHTDPHSVSSIGPEFEGQGPAPEPVVAAQQVVGDNIARNEHDAQWQPDFSTISAAIREWDAYPHVSDPAFAPQDIGADEVPSKESTQNTSEGTREDAHKGPDEHLHEGLHAFGPEHESPHEFVSEESAAAHNDNSEPTKNDPLGHLVAPWTSLHWSADLQDHDLVVLPDAVSSEPSDATAPEVESTLASASDGIFAAASNAPDSPPVAIEHDVHDSVAPDNPAPRDPLTPEEIEAAVTRIVERMQPRVAELLTRELLRPIVEALVQDEISKR